jgi:Sulfotransferase family
MTDKIFFFHNPKAGGVSLRTVFESHFPTERQCPIIENDKVGHEHSRGEYAHFRGYDYYAGHYGRDIFEVVNDGHFSVTNFRNPVTRLISLYNYFRFNVKLSEQERCSERFHAVLFAKSVGFEEFVSSEDPRVEVYVRNAHFRQLADSCWALETTKNFKDVCRFVDAMRWYYVCEYPEMSAAWVQRSLGWRLAQIPKQNVTRPPSEQAADLATLDNQIHTNIVAKNELDIALYRYALRRLVAQLTDSSGGLQNIIRGGSRSLSKLLARKRSKPHER